MSHAARGRKPRIGVAFGATTPDRAFGRPRDAILRAYTAAVRGAGGVPLGLAPAPVDDVPDLLAEVHGLVLTGGGDIDPATYGEPPAPEAGKVDHERDAFDIALARLALESALPLLAICRGAQVLNVALGGTLVQHLSDHAPRTLEARHDVKIDSSSTLAGVIGSDLLEVNSLHHQAVAGPGRGVRPVAWSTDGVIEAFEVTGHPQVVAVQWHPELLQDIEVHRRLFDRLVVDASARRRK